jgi:hypothetical protein
MITINAEPLPVAQDYATQSHCAYLGITRSCQLASPEFDTSAMCRVIDVLAELGVEVISLSGAGEPLLRDDFDQIINHASARGLRVQLTSNGAMPRICYQRLLASSVDEIVISVDPFQAAAAGIFASLRYLHKHLPAGKSLTVHLDIPWAKRTQLGAFLNTARMLYPRATVQFGNALSPALAHASNTSASLPHGAAAPPPPPPRSLRAQESLCA